MNIVLLVKQVPDTYSERKVNPSDGVLDRDATDAVLDTAFSPTRPLPPPA